VYRERPAEVPGGVLWTSVAAEDGVALIVPDGCMDLMWFDGALQIAGPDTGPYPTRMHAGAGAAGLRFAPGAAPAALCVGLTGRAGPADPLVGALVAQARAGRPVTGMAERAGLSQRQLLRRCLPAFGYGPKTLARILRAQRALALARSARRPGFAEVAVAAGYADQAHLSREIRALTGRPLGAAVRPES